MTIIPADVAVNPAVSFGRRPNSPEQKEPASGLFLASAQMLCLYGLIPVYIFQAPIWSIGWRTGAFSSLPLAAAELSAWQRLAFRCIII